MRTEKNRRKKRFMNITLLSIIVGMLVWGIMEEYRDTQTKNIPNMKIEKTSMINTIVGENNTSQQIIKEYPKEEIIKTYKGYDVIAKLQIPSINLQTHILKENSKEALNKSVVKFWGANPNQTGNLCIAGHNAPNKNMFRNLNKLKNGERLFITDHEVGKIEYEITDIYKVLPEDISCLDQKTNGTRQVTLITCTNNSTKRIIVKAKEVE